MSDLDEESRRMAAVRRYDILDTPPDGAFDRIAAIAAVLLDVPIAIISIVDRDRIWFKARHGLDVNEVGRDPGLCASAIRGAEPWVVTDALADPRALANPLVAGELGLRFYAGVPLTTHDGHNLGTLCVIDQQPRRVSEQQLRALTLLGSVVMDELELRLRARKTVADAEKRAVELELHAQALQRSLLPPALPDIPFVRLAAAYQPASRLEVGGDFYDVFPIDEQSWGFSMGDVCGKGPAAAGVTSSARWSMRTAAIHHRLPSAVLHETNQAILPTIESRSSLEGSFVTALFAVVRPHTDGAHVLLALAGHPRPAVLRASGYVETVGAPGTLLGIVQETHATDVDVELGPGDTLVLFTDGVLDSGRPQRLGQGGLDAILRRHRGRSAQSIVNALVPAATMAQRDDVAILAIQAVGPDE
ncbi:MAG TPA: GAF domain-containing SpoIIE family protein phosphatase [Actinomycetales bacterium]|nr:GAF domain-containing SpoIIE family protein phosphatase [Actinomycetales bacterium]